VSYFKFSLPRFRQHRTCVVTPKPGDLYAALAACKVVDSFLFLLSPDGVSIMAQGLTSPLFVLNDIETVPQKKRGDYKKPLTQEHLITKLLGSKMTMKMMTMTITTTTLMMMMMTNTKIWTRKRKVTRKLFGQDEDDMEDMESVTETETDDAQNYGKKVSFADDQEELKRLEGKKITPIKDRDV